MEAIELKEVPILETNFIGSWIKNHDNPKFKKLFSGKTKAFFIQPLYTEEEKKILEKDWSFGATKFRPIFCDLIEILKKLFNCEIALRINGPVQSKHLLRVYQYITGDWQEDCEHRFYIPEVKYLDKGPGYVHKEVSMEYVLKYVRRMMDDKEIEFAEQMGIAGFMVDDKLVAKYLTIDYFKNEAVLKAIEETYALFRTFSHFEGLYIISNKLQFDELANCLRSAFEVRDTTKK